MGKGVEGPQRDAGGMLLGRARAQGEESEGFMASHLAIQR